MASQFMRLEGYGMCAGKYRKSHETAGGILAEATRTKGHIPHIRRPKAPNVLHGVTPTDLLGDLANLAQTARDRRGAKIRVTSTILYAVVASYPTAWRNLDMEQSHLEYQAWRTATTQWLIRQFGGQLAAVVEHVDEAYPHIHAFALPLLDSRNRLNHELHPGYVARRRAIEMGADAIDGERAYRRGMRAWQDDYHQCVSRIFGHSRIGPRRQRFRRDAALARQSAGKLLDITSNLAESVLALVRTQAPALEVHGEEIANLAAISKLIREVQNEISNGRPLAFSKLDAAVGNLKAMPKPLGVQPEFSDERHIDLFFANESSVDDDVRPPDVNNFDNGHDDDPDDDVDTEHSDGLEEDIIDADWNHVEYSPESLEKQDDW